MLLVTRRLPFSTLFPYTTLFRSFWQQRTTLLETTRFWLVGHGALESLLARPQGLIARGLLLHVPSLPPAGDSAALRFEIDRKSTRLNSSHLVNSYAVFRLKKTNVHPLVPAATFEAEDEGQQLERERQDQQERDRRDVVRDVTGQAEQHERAHRREQQPSQV